jgi:haloacetate dehalogenase
MEEPMFPNGFREFDVDTSAARIHGVIGGAGQPLLLLHGIPETHLIWRDVASRLAADFTLVATDLRGFGASRARGAERSADDYSMRSLARDQVEAMAALGFTRFCVAGHDRGARCAYRLAIDYPAQVERLGVLDIVPTGDAFERADRTFALDFWVWTFLAAPSPIPETLVLHAPEAFVDHMLQTWSGRSFHLPAEARTRYIDQFRDPARVHAICEQYRAAATVDVASDLADRPRRPIACPTLALWSGEGAVAKMYDPLAIWQNWADDVQGRPTPGGHFLPEEVPDLVSDEFVRFFKPREQTMAASFDGRDRIA